MPVIQDVRGRFTRLLVAPLPEWLQLNSEADGDGDRGGDGETGRIRDARPDILPETDTESAQHRKRNRNHRH